MYKEFTETLHIVHKHLVLVASTLVALGLGLMLFSGDKAEAERTAIPLTPELSFEIEFPPVQSIPVPDTFEQNPWTTLKVNEGDNLSLLFERAGLGAAQLSELLAKTNKAEMLTKLRPGQDVQFLIENGQLVSMKIQLDKLRTLQYDRSLNGYVATEHELKPEVRYKVATAIVESTLYQAAEKADMPQNLIMELANIFGGSIDFVYDVRKNDRFTVVYEDLYVDGERFGNGNILAAEYTNRGRNYQAYRYEDIHGETSYYTETGESMRKAFLRAPLEFARITSGFNPNRLHPIFKTRRPHRGIDYGAARGTPVYAAGDGRVTKSGKSKSMGNYVIIQHGPSYTTKYMHLDKRAVKSNQKVKQKQIIGWVGSTGYATGPHLHYEFLLNGVHRNPKTIINQLPKARTIPESELTHFRQQISGLRLQLQTFAAQRAQIESKSG